MSKYSDQQKYEAAMREVRFRQRVYARRVAAKKMTKEQADREIAVMVEIAEDYRVKSELPL